MRRWGNVYLHIYAIGGISALCVAIKYRIGDEHLSYTNHNHNQNLVDSIRENLTNGLGTNISILNIFLGSHLSEISKKFRLLKIDLRIMKCLLEDPRMKYLDIARIVSCSQRTVIRRIEKLERNHVILNFSIIHNPSKMKGYNYFSVIIKTDTNQSKNVMKQILYSEIRLTSFKPRNYTINKTYR